MYDDDRDMMVVYFLKKNECKEGLINIVFLREILVKNRRSTDYESKGSRPHDSRATTATCATTGTERASRIRFIIAAL